MKLPDYVSEMIDRLEENGYSAYVVGGAVRDSLMRRRPLDYDLCTDAEPARIREVFFDRDVFCENERFGTIVVRSGENAAEITTMREDGEYSDARHPDAVRFTKSLKRDLARRDFTVNAMAYNPKSGIYDPFGGRADARARVLRAVGDPRERFSQDALRIMRMARFSAQLGCEPEPQTLEAANELCATLSAISPERVRDELYKLLMCDKPNAAIERYKQIIFAVIPELAACDGFLQYNPNHAYDVFKHTVETVGHTGKNLTLRLAALLHDVGKPLCFTQDETGRGRFYGHMEAGEELSRGILARLRVPQKTAETISMLVLNHDKPYAATPESARFWLNRVGRKNIFLLIDLKKADCLAHAKSYHNRLGRIYGFRREVQNALARHDCFSLNTLAVNGADVNRALSLSPGPLTGEILDALLSAVIEGRAQNEKSELITLALEYNNERTQPQNDSNRDGQRQTN